MFHPKFDWLISDSEDKTIRIWDITKNTLIFTQKRENDRFWTLAAHPTNNLFAAGHDNGFIVFKLQKERPIYCKSEDGVYFLKDRSISFSTFSGKETLLSSIQLAASPKIQPVFLSQQSNSFMICYANVKLKLSLILPLVCFFVTLEPRM